MKILVKFFFCLGFSVFLFSYLSISLCFDKFLFLLLFFCFLLMFFHLFHIWIIIFLFNSLNSFLNGKSVSNKVSFVKNSLALLINPSSNQLKVVWLYLYVLVTFYHHLLFYLNLIYNFFYSLYHLYIFPYIQTMITRPLFLLVLVLFLVLPLFGSPYSLAYTFAAVSFAAFSSGVSLSSFNTSAGIIVFCADGDGDGGGGGPLPSDAGGGCSAGFGGVGAFGFAAAAIGFGYCGSGCGGVAAAGGGAGGGITTSIDGLTPNLFNNSLASSLFSFVIVLFPDLDFIVS
jgi:hypothetical protein